MIFCLDFGSENCSLHQPIYAVCDAREPLRRFQSLLLSWKCLQKNFMGSGCGGTSFPARFWPYVMNQDTFETFLNKDCGTHVRTPGKLSTELCRKSMRRGHPLNRFLIKSTFCPFFRSGKSLSRVMTFKTDSRQAQKTSSSVGLIEAMSALNIRGCQIHHDLAFPSSQQQK